MIGHSLGRMKAWLHAHHHHTHTHTTLHTTASTTEVHCLFLLVCRFVSHRLPLGCFLCWIAQPEGVRCCSGEASCALMFCVIRLFSCVLALLHEPRPSTLAMPGVNPQALSQLDQEDLARRICRFMARQLARLDPDNYSRSSSRPLPIDLVLCVHF